MAATTTTAGLSGLNPGSTYYFAARACDAAGLNCSGYSNEVSATTPAAAPVADFSVSTRSGLAPLTVTFSCQSSGTISSRAWSFGDGTSSTAATAVKTYTTPGIYDVSLLVKGPGGEDKAVKSGFVEVKAPAPVAGFTANTVKGTAPLVVSFRNTSTGLINSSTWTFGDGARSTDTNPTHTYATAGIYPVTLTVTGPGGQNTLARTGYMEVLAGDGGKRPMPDAPLELGELQVDHQWQRVSFTTPFTDPIVVAGPLGYNGSDPAVVRVKGIDSTGFWIRVQEWDYLDGTHTTETLSYLVMERGRHQLPDGAWVEAGRLVTGATNGFVAQPFSEPLYETPVVFATVTSVNEADAVTTRLRKVSVQGFEVGMQEQESKAQKHLPESIDYIALEPSFGEVNGTRYEVGLMPSGVTDKPLTLLYQGVYAQAPRFLADMQTTNDTNTANLRWTNRNETSLELWISEERSSDSEVTHGTESLGYLLAEGDSGQLKPTLSTPTGTANLTAEGLADWVHWGKDSAGGLNRKAGVAGQIGALTTFGGSASRFLDTARLRYGWSDGAPTLSATTQAGLYIAGLNKGFELRVPADTSERTLVLYLGGWQARGRIEVGLSDGSAPDFVQTIEDLGTAFDRRLALSYRAASAGQTLLVRYIQTTTSGNITVQAATLQTTAEGDSGQLEPTLSSPTGTASLTAEGLADWVHWGKDSAGSLNRKKGVSGQIGALTTLGGSASRFLDTARLRYSWSDGAPTLSATTQAGLYIAGLNKGFELRVPADTAERTLVLYLGGWQARGRIEVGLSDGSAADFVQTIENLSAAFDRRLALTYRAGSAGQTLVVRYIQTTTSGNITVQAATLQTTAEGDSGQLEPTLSTPTGTASLTAEGLADWVHWGKDSAGSLNRKKGVSGQIGALTTLGGSASRFLDTARLRYGWSDGAPTLSATTQAGLYIAGLNKGFELRVPADTSERTLVLYLGGWQARGRIEVGLSDGSAADFVQTIEDLGTAFDRRLALTYRAGSAGQTLVVRYTQTTTTGNITVQAATLQGASVPIP